MSKEELDAAFRVAMTILGGAVGGFIILVVGNRLRGSTDSAVKRRQFRSYLTLLCRRIESKASSDFVHGSELREFSKLEAEVLEVRHCIVCRLVGRFDAAVDRYKTTSFDVWAGPDQKRQEARDTNNEKSKAELVSSLKELYRYAWWMA